MQSITTGRKLRLDGSALSVTRHYQFMNPITETSYEKIRLNLDVHDHVIQNCEKEVSDLFSEKTVKILKENKEEITLTRETADEFKQYIKKIIVKELLFSKKLLDNFEEEISVMIVKAMSMNVTVTLKREIAQIKIVGKETDVNKIHEQLKNEISKMEDDLNVVTKSIELHEHKIQLFLLHGVEKLISNEFHVEINTDPGKKSIVIKGAKAQVLSAENKILQKFTGIVEDKYDLTEARKIFLKSGGTRILNNGMKEFGLKGMILPNGAKSNKAKLLAFEDAKIKEVILFLKENMFERKYLLEEESIALLNSNKWEEFCENMEKNTSVRVSADKETPTQVFLIGEKREVVSTYQTLVEFMKRNTIVNVRIDLNEGYSSYVKEYCTNVLEDIEKKLEEQNVRVQLIVDEQAIRIEGTKDGAKAAKDWIDDILSKIATDKIRLERERIQTYLQSGEGKVFIEVTESKYKCKILVTEDNGNGPTKLQSKQLKSASKLLCSYETKEKISLKSESPSITLKEKPSPMKNVIFLEIYATDNNTIKCVKEKVFNIIESQKEKKLIQDSDVEKLSRQQITEIKDLCELNEVKVAVEKYLNRIVISGHRDDVFKTTEKIYQILKHVGEEEKEKGKEALHVHLAEIVSQGVQWLYQNPQNGDYEEYDTRTNAAIEKAYSKKEKSVIFVLEDGKCEIVFEKMEERNLDTKVKLKVIRKDLKGIPYS